MTSLFGTRPEAAGDIRPTRRTRTWNDGGIQYTQQESSYNGPNSAFFTFSRTAGLSFDDRDPSRTSHGRRASLLGTVVNGLADYVTSNSQRSTADRGHARRKESHDDGLAYGNSNRNIRRRSHGPKSLLSKVAAGLTEPKSSNRHGPRVRRDSRAPDHPQNFNNRSAANARPVFVEEYTSSDESDTSDSLDSDDSADYSAVLEALENTAEYHRRESRRARRRLDQASRQGMGNSRHFQTLVNEVKEHDNAKARALRDLEEARAEMMAQERIRSHQTRPVQRERVIETMQDDPISNHPFFGGIFGSPHQRHPVFAASSGRQASSPFGSFPFAVFDDLFADMERVHGIHGNTRQHRFSIPGASFSASFGTQQRANRASTTSGAGFQQRQPPSFTNFTPQPAQPAKPPATLLKPEEAKWLHATYNERWGTISATDANIPFPARGLKSANLSSRNSLWAPSCSSPVNTWSEETVMKANTQAFFLGAVGMKPAYTEGAGAKIELGVDKASGTTTQVQQLITILKKERVRWHSDRLGKRNGDRAGVNEALQNDERARAVYHGICELIEAAQ